MTTKRLSAQLIDGLQARGGDACTLAVRSGALVGWRLDLVAHLAEGTFEVGSVRIVPDRSSRVVALACVPGATSFEVIATCLDPTAPDPDIELELVVAYTHGAPGFSDLERRGLHSISGSVNGVQLLPWQRPTALLVRAGGVDATYSIEAGVSITVPAGQAVGIDFGHQGPWGALLTVANVTNWVLQYEG